MGPAPALGTVRRSAATALARVLPEPEAGLAAGILSGCVSGSTGAAADFATAGVSGVRGDVGLEHCDRRGRVGALGGSWGTAVAPS